MLEFKQKFVFVPIAFIYSRLNYIHVKLLSCGH
jgi:hypothetical protein